MNKLKLKFTTGCFLFVRTDIIPWRIKINVLKFNSAGCRCQIMMEQFQFAKWLLCFSGTQFESITTWKRKLRFRLRLSSNSRSSLAAEMASIKNARPACTLRRVWLPWLSMESVPHYQQRPSLSRLQRAEQLVIIFNDGKLLVGRRTSALFGSREACQIKRNKNNARADKHL